MIAASTATQITALVVGFFALLALIALARAIFHRGPPAAARFRVGVFVERDHEPEPPAQRAGDNQPQQPVGSAAGKG